MDSVSETDIKMMKSPCLWLSCKKFVIFHLLKRYLTHSKPNKMHMLNILVRSSVRLPACRLNIKNLHDVFFGLALHSASYSFGYAWIALVFFHSHYTLYSLRFVRNVAKLVCFFLVLYMINIFMFDRFVCTISHNACCILKFDDSMARQHWIPNSNRKYGKRSCFDFLIIFSFGSSTHNLITIVGRVVCFFLHLLSNRSSNCSGYFS